MAKIEINRITNANIYLDGANLLGRAEEVKLPDVSMGDSVGGWFKEKLGIHSPSRVFMGFGDNIAQGAAIGLQRTTPLAALAGQKLAEEMTPDVPRLPSPEIMAAGYGGRGAGAAAGVGATGGIQVNYNPQFYLNSKETAAPAGLTGALNMSVHAHQLA